MQLIEFLYSDDYDLYPLYVDCGDQGHTGVARPRVYIICAHKRCTRKILNVQKVYDMVTRAIQARVHTRVRDYLDADRWEILREASTVAFRRKRSFETAPGQALSLFRPCNPHASVTQSHGIASLECQTQEAPELDLTPLLNNREQRALHNLCLEYLARFGSDPEQDADFMIYLGDSESRKC